MPKKGATLKEPTSIRLTPEAKQLLGRLAEKNGVSLSAWMETLIRREARREKIVGNGLETESARKEAARARVAALLAEAQSNDPGDLTPEELEREVTLAHEE